MLLKIDIPDVLSQHLTQTAKAADMTVDRFVALAVAEKIARFEHNAWLLQARDRARRTLESIGLKSIHGAVISNAFRYKYLLRCSLECRWVPHIRRSMHNFFHGENSPVAKLTKKQAQERLRRNLVGELHQPLAQEFGVSVATIGKLVRGLRWKECRLSDYVGSGTLLVKQVGQVARAFTRIETSPR